MDQNAGGIATPRRMGTLVVLMLFAAIGGCTPWANYPPIEGATGLDNPTTEPIPTLMAEALVYAWNQDGATGELVFNLPEGTRGLVYDRVVKKMGGGRPMDYPNEPAYHVAAVRVRTTKAEVDVIRNPGATPKLVTISFDQEFVKGYQVVRARTWRFPVGDLPPSYYVPEPQRTVEEPEPEVPGE